MSPQFQKVHRPPLFPITITSVLSKVFELLVFVPLGRFMEHSGVPPTKVYRLKKVDATRIPTKTEYCFKGL